MTLTEIIKELQKYEKEFGDIKVWAADWEKCHLIRSVEVVTYPSGLRRIEFRLWK